MAKWMEGAKIFLFGSRVPCEYCQSETDEPLIVEHKGKTEYFCGELCASLLWLERMRYEGL
jgi:hypothetical protein